MTLDEAIRGLKDALELIPPGLKLRHHDAIRLGIEALRDKKMERVILWALSRQLLPGETRNEKCGIKEVKDGTDIS